MSRLADEYDAADRHDLDNITEEPGPTTTWFSSCACGWDGYACFTKAEALQEHDTHQDVQLGLAGTRTVWPRHGEGA